MKRKVLPPYHVKTSTSEKKLISTVKEQFIQLKKEEVTIIPYGFTILGDKTSKLIPQVELANHQISLIKRLKLKAVELLKSSVIEAAAIAYDAHVIDEEGIDKDALSVILVRTEQYVVQINFPYVVADNELVFGEWWVQ
jgi:hypothetical protein